MMTKEDYEKVVDVLGRLYIDRVLDVQTLSKVVERFAEMFEKNNKRFDSEAFYNAVDLRVAQGIAQRAMKL